jgi:type II secretory pathway pseudopilin PulG
MLNQSWFKLAVFLVVVILCVAMVEAWRADRRDRGRLAAELAATKQLLASADARQHDRDAQLNQTLAALAAEKRAVVTPAQIIRDLPRELPLPTPITLQAPPTAPGASTSPNAKPAETQVVIPAEDLKPLYNFTLDCRACQAKLATAQSDLTDEKSKTAALTKERDQALQIARGGSAWRRFTRATKWFFIGAAAGAIAAKTAR